MCGIAGYYSEKIGSEVILKNVLSDIEHRGPDHCECYFDHNFGFAHARLSIIDLHESSNQPLFSSDERYCIVYNGEIYNYKEIRKDLISRGVCFNTNSDTEVILNGFIEFGEQFIGRLNGMFAFAIYDRYDGSIFFARDRHGIKPLFYFYSDDAFWFCSEFKPLDKHISKEKSLESAVLLLLLGSIPFDVTINEKIKKFPAGHWGWYKNKKLVITRYYQLDYLPKILDNNIDLIDNIREKTIHAVNDSLISDAPIGTFLSGGLDSSIITAVASKSVPDLKTVSVSFEDKRYSEASFQKLVSDKYNTEHHEYHVTKEIFQDEFISYLDIVDQPNIDGFNTFLASKAAKSAGLKAILAGQGADELFYSYDTFLNAKKLREIHFSPYIIVFLRKIKELIRNRTFSKDASLYWNNIDLSLYLPIKQIFKPSQIANLLGVDINRILSIILNNFMRLDTSNIKELDDKVSFYEIKLYLENQLLAKDDMSSMSQSLEIRIPFLDNRLVDYVTKIPPKFKYDKEIPKILLAKAFEAELPKEIICRDKSGFSVPYGAWLKNVIKNTELMTPRYVQLFLDKRIGWTQFMVLIMLNKFYPEIELNKNYE